MRPSLLAISVLGLIAAGAAHGASDGCPDAVDALIEAARTDPVLDLTAAQQQRLLSLARQLCDGMPTDADQASAPAAPSPSLLDRLTRETEKTAGHKRLERLKR